MTNRTIEKPDNSTSTTIFKTSFDEALRPWIEEYGREAYLQAISDPKSHELPGYLQEIRDIAEKEHLAEMHGEPLLADQAARELKQLKRRLNGERRDVLEEILGAMDRMAEVVEDLGASAPDRKTYDDYMRSRRLLESTRTLVEPHMRKRLSAPDRRLSLTDFVDAINEVWHTFWERADSDASGTARTAMRVFSRMVEVSRLASREADADKPETQDAYNELHRVLQSLDRNVLEGICDIMDNLTDAVEDVGSYATDDESKYAFMSSKRWLEKIDAFVGPLRIKLKSMPKKPSVEQPPVEQPEQPPVEQPVEQPPVEQPVEQPPVEGSDRESWKKAFQDVMNEVLRPWYDKTTGDTKNEKGEELPSVTAAKKVIEYTNRAWKAAGRVRRVKKGEESPEADEARRISSELTDELNKEDMFIVKDVYNAIDRMDDAVKNLIENTTDEAAVKIYKRGAQQLKIAKEHLVKPAYDKRFHEESPAERADRLYSIAIERLMIPQQALDDAFSNTNEYGWDALLDIIDAVNDVYSAEIMKGGTPDATKFDRMNSLKQSGLHKARALIDRMYYESDVFDAFYAWNHMVDVYNSIRMTRDAKVRQVANCFYYVFLTMKNQYGHNESEREYDEYLDGIPEVPEDWELSSDEKLKNLKNLNDDLLYILSRDGMREGIGKYFPPNVKDPLRFLVEHYTPPELKNQTTFENWKNTEPLLRELAEQLPWGGVDTEHTVNMLASQLQDAQKYYTDTHRATPYELFMSKLVREPERTQEMMARSDFRFERDEYIKRLRKANGLEGEDRARMLNGILSDMNSDIASIRNLGSSANDPLPRDLKGDMEFIRNGAMKFKTDLEQLRDAVTDSMNGGTAEPPGWTGYADWAELLNPDNPLDGTEYYQERTLRDEDAKRERHFRARRKFYPTNEVKDMWNNPRGDPQSIMKRLRKSNIIPGAHPEYSTQPVIGPEDFEELSAMVGSNYYNRKRLDSNQPGLYEFSQKALYIASNLAFDLKNEEDRKAVQQFEQALEIAGRCRKGESYGAPRQGLSTQAVRQMHDNARRNVLENDERYTPGVADRVEANRLGSGRLTYSETRDMFRGALRD